MAITFVVAVAASAGVGEPGGGVSPAQENESRTATATATPETKFNESNVERLIFELVNEKRSLRDMPAFAYNDKAAATANKHAEDMATKDYFSHTSLGGETQQERYSFCNGGENAHQTWVERQIILPNGETTELETNGELAKSIVMGWMHSEPHRERGIYGEYWWSAGVGVALSDDGKVYAVLGFCQR